VWREPEDEPESGVVNCADDADDDLE
jgi:hypothetical protein